MNGERTIGKIKAYYNNGNLYLEGECLNEKIWNGKGYNIKGDEEFEIKDGKGYIKEYDYEGTLIYEGDYSKGKRNGKGKEYDYDGALIYEGDYSNGKRNGKGKEYEFGTLVYEGEYFRGKRKIKNI